MRTLIYGAVVLASFGTHARAQYADLVFAVSERFGSASPSQVCQNDGTGRFSCAAVAGTAGNNLGVAAFDLDGDGDSDLAFANDTGDSDQLCVQNGVATGTFTCGPINGIDQEESWGVTAADLDRDGDADLIFADFNEDFSNLCVQDGMGQGTFSCVEMEAYAAGDVLAADLNGDGLPDLAFTGDDDSPNRVCTQAGGFAFTCVGLASDAEGTAVGVTSADFDGDGDIDLAYAEVEFFQLGHTDQLCLNDGDAGFSCSTLGLYASLGVTAADLDADGDADLAFSSGIGRTQPNRVCLNDGTAAFTCTNLTLATLGDVEAADFDGDGDLDLAFSGTSGSAALCFQDGLNAGTYTCQPLAVSGAFRIAVGNFGGARLRGGVASEPAPSATPLLAVTPNPGRADVDITLTVTTAGPARVEVVDALGRRVAIVHDGPLAAGTHTLSPRLDGLPAGVYVVRVVTATATASRALTVVR